MNSTATGTRLHPAAVLYPQDSQRAAIPCVDHYAGSEKFMRKALALQAESPTANFDITFDCEDGAVVGEEAVHATRSAELLMSSENHFGRVGVRIHDVTHPAWFTELETFIADAGSRIAFITLPKARDAADVQRVLRAVRHEEIRCGLHRPIPLHVLIETHGALRDAWTIASMEGVASLDFGLMDFVSEHHGAIPASAMRSPGQFEHPLMRRAKCEIVAAALAHDAVPTHNVCTDITNADAVFNDARRAREEFGFLRMWSIHPAQIEPILRAMRPAMTEVDEAAELLCAAQDANWGPIQSGGRLHDRASYRYYWNLLNRAQSLGCDVPDFARQRFFDH